MPCCACFSAVGRSLGLGTGEPPSRKRKVVLPQLEVSKVVSVTSVAKHSSRSNVSYSARYRQRSFDEDFDMDDEVVLGIGLSGPVRQATHRELGRRFAVKSFSKRQLSSKQRDDLRREVEVYLALDHPHVARLEYVYEEDLEIMLVMELLEGGEVHERLLDRGVYTEADAAGAVQQMLLAVSYLHSKGMIHRDIKLQNFLYYRTDSTVLKLIDFGFAKYWNESSELLTKACGTPDFVAPEVLDNAYSAKADMWSVGVCAYMLLTGYAPFPGKTVDQVFSKIKARDVAWCKQFFLLSEEAQAFVKSLMNFDPNLRLSAGQALEMPWMVNRDTLRSSQSSMVQSLDRATLRSLRSFASASSFRRAVLSMMAWSLTAEDREELEHEFKEIDKTNSGFIKLGEFKEALQEHFFVDGAEAAELFARIDADNDSELAYSEFLAAALSTRLDMHEEIIRRTFDRLDADDSGCICAADLRQVLGDSFDGREVDDLLQEADKEGTGRVSFEQFLNWMRTAAAETSQGPAGRRQTMVDRLIQSVSFSESDSWAYSEGSNARRRNTEFSRLRAYSESISPTLPSSRPSLRRRSTRLTTRGSRISRVSLIREEDAAETTATALDPPVA